MNLVVPCPICGTDVSVPMFPDEHIEDGYRAPDLISVVSAHVEEAHQIGTSGM